MYGIPLEILILQQIHNAAAFQKKLFGWRADIHELRFPEEEPTDWDWEIDEKI